MNFWLYEKHIKLTSDFYETILYRFYGRRVDASDTDYKVIVYFWKDKIYLDNLEKIDE